MAWLFRLFSKQCNTAMHIVDIEFADRYIQHACKKFLRISWHSTTRKRDRTLLFLNFKLPCWATDDSTSAVSFTGWISGTQAQGCTDLQSLTTVVGSKPHIAQ